MCYRIDTAANTGAKTSWCSRRSSTDGLRGRWEVDANMKLNGFFFVRVLTGVVLVADECKSIKQKSM